MNKVNKLIKPVKELHTKYVDEYCRKCRTQGCYSDDLRNGNITTEEVVTERIIIYGYRQNCEDIRDDYSCYLG